jgi:SOS-response transcriptional repressor LexA
MFGGVGMSMGLTPRQRRLLAYLSAREVCPTYREMSDALKLSSTHAVYNLLRQLIERGRITARFNRGGDIISRSIEVVEHPVFFRGKRFRFISKSRAVSPFGADKTGGALANCVPGRLFEGAK